MDLPFNKIMVDSRHASEGTSAKFSVSLPETITLPHTRLASVPMFA